jgi:integrase
MPTLTIAQPANGYSLTAHDLAGLPGLAGLSAMSPSVALARPVGDLVTATLDAAGRSDQSKRSYLAVIGQFLAYLDETHGANLPPDRASWRPFAEAGQEGKRTVWTFKAPSVVLRLVTPASLAGFQAWLEARGAGTNTAAQRVAGARTFLAVALRDGVLTEDQARALDLQPYRARQKRDTQPVGRRLTKHEVRKLRSAPDLLTLKGKRDLAILDAMLYLGLRCEECAEIRLEDFRQDGGRWLLVLTG